MSVLIVIPCLNEEAMLPRLLEQFTLENPGVRIVVADGGSHDRSRAIVADHAQANVQIVLLDNPDRLQSAGINLAVQRYGEGCQWLVRVDAHCDYPADYVAGLVRTAAAHEATAVVVPMVSIGQSCFQLAAATAQNSKLGTGGSLHRHIGEGRWVDHGHHALMSIDLFRLVGGYRRDMSHNEDAELDHRLTAAGGRLWLEPSLALGYYPRATVAGLWRQYSAYGRGRARTLAIHGMRPKARQMLPVAAALSVLLALATPIWPLAAVPMALWALLCLGWGFAAGLKAGGGCRLAAGFAAGIMHMAWGLGFLSAQFSTKKEPDRKDFS